MAMLRSTVTGVSSLGEPGFRKAKSFKRCIVDTNGVSWQALYTLERQPEGSLKISGAVLSKSGVALARTAHHDHLAASASSPRLPRLAKLAPASVEAHETPAEPAAHRLNRVMHRAKLVPASVDANKAPVERATVEGVQNDCPRLRICAPGAIHRAKLVPA